MYTYMTKGTCSTQVYVHIEDGILKDAEFVGGCNGNLKGICALVKGMPVEEVKSRLSGIKCGFKQTSCPDQLAKAIEEAMAK
jgi:uncharacterized protein (TIGR03905 family)